MEDTVKKARNYAWKCFAVLSVGAVIHLITHTEDSKEYLQQMAALRGVSVADYVIMTGGPTRLIKAFFPAQPLLIPNL